MINVIQTLKNLNKEFPRYQLETLLKIVECIQDDSRIYEIKTDPWWSKDITYKNYPVSYTQNCTSSCTSASTQPQAFVYNTTTKNHTADKTSYKQNIISEGEDATLEGLDLNEILNDMKQTIPLKNEDIDALYKAIKASNITCG